MHYHIEFLSAALEQLRAMPKDARRLIGAKLDRAQHDLAGDIKKLKGFKNKYRLRAGNYRVLFELALALWCMMSVTGKTFMSNATLTAKPPGNWTQLNKQLVQAKTLLRQMSRTIEDIEDARTIERAKRANGSKPRIPWEQVKKELQLG
ncbi:MAG: type II toxin-antitoxin system RelE family toxin [Limisphaerales bacterium]